MSDRDQWKGGVRYGAPPAPSATKIPTPAELAQESALLIEGDVVKVVTKALAELRKSGGRTVVSGDDKRVLEEAARRFRASGWKCKVEPATQRDPCMLTVSAECLDCHGGGLVGYGPQERPCACRSQGSEYPR